MDIRVAAYGVITQGDRILLAHWNESGRSGWTLPGGGIDPGEDPVDAVVREIAEETFRPRDLKEGVVSSLQRVRMDEEDATDELASLSESAEALRLTAAAPPRPSPSGSEYE